MKKFYIDYYDKSGDLCHIWVNASNKAEAESEARSEWWDIAEIVSIREGR